jgi:hypothetical protein
LVPVVCSGAVQVSEFWLATGHGNGFVAARPAQLQSEKTALVKFGARRLEAELLVMVDRFTPKKKIGLPGTAGCDDLMKDE